MKMISNLIQRLRQMKADYQMKRLRAARKLVLRDVRQKLAAESSAARQEHYRSGQFASLSHDRAYFEAVRARNALTAEIFRLIPA